MELVS